MHKFSVGFNHSKISQNGRQEEKEDQLFITRNKA